MEEHRDQTPRRSLWRMGLSATALVGAIGAAWALRLPERLPRLLEWVSALGPWAPVAFIGIYIVAAVLFVPGSILTLGAGVVFGVVWGTGIASLAATAGACAAFLVGRRLARGWVTRKIERHPRFRAIDEAVGTQGWKIVLLARLSPVIPYNLLNYALGLTRVKFVPYALASWIGMLPGTLMYVYVGSAVGELAKLGAGDRGRSPLEWSIFAAGLAATVVVAVYVTRLGRRALGRALEPSGGGADAHPAG